MFKNVGQRYAVDDADGNLADNAGLDDLRGNPFCEGKEEEKGDDDQNLNGCDRSVGE